jgi:ribonuclease D
LLALNFLNWPKSLGLPVENLMTPDVIRRVLWTPPDDVAGTSTNACRFNARPWQIEIVGPVLETAIWGLDKSKTNEP